VNSDTAVASHSGPRCGHEVPGMTAGQRPIQVGPGRKVGQGAGPKQQSGGFYSLERPSHAGHSRDEHGN